MIKDNNICLWPGVVFISKDWFRGNYAMRHKSSILSNIRSSVDV